MIGTFGNMVPAGDDWIARKLADLQRQITELRAARTLESATIGEGGITVKGGSITLDGGDLVAAGGVVQSGNFDAGASGWQLKPGGNAEFNDLTLRGGIIGNDALASPVTGARCDGTTTGITLPVDDDATLHTETINVPAGFSQALVIATVSVGGAAPGIGAAVSAAVKIGSHISDNIITSWANDADDGITGLVQHSTAFFSAILTGLSGGDDLNVSALGHVVNTPDTFTDATARVTALALFLR